jgi:dTDP-4-amino-4,6-dideoxygalactose transaminase
VDIGSSFLPSDIIAAFLLAQLDEAEPITERRMAIYRRYHASFEELEARGLLRRPIVPAHCTHNAHMYYLKAQEIYAVFHYVPLHDAPAGKKYARAHGSLDVTRDTAGRLIRLPLWINMSDEEVQRVIDVTSELVEEYSN